MSAATLAARLFIIDPNPEAVSSAKVINRVPSPVGSPLFSSVGAETFSQSSSVQLLLAPPQSASYSYSCSVGQCSGSAKDVWCAMTDQQQQDYLTAVIQASRAEPPLAWEHTDCEGSLGAAGVFTASVVGGNSFSQKLSVASSRPDESVIRYIRYC